MYSVKCKSVFAVIAAIVLTSSFLSCSNKKSLFTRLPASQTNISFKNTLEKKQLFNILYYLYYYNGGGVATGDVNNDGLPDIFFTANHKGGNKLYINKGNFKFEDVTDKAGVAGDADWSTGVTMADVNGDGLLDIYVCVVSGVFDLKGENELYINNGDGTFTNKAKDYGLNFQGLSTQAAFFDYDKDGDLDCYLLRHSKRPHENIVDTSARKRIDPLAGDKFLRNDINVKDSSGGHFTDVSSQAGIYQSSLGYGLGVAVADFNNDGWDDIYIGNDFHENDYYYLNNGNGTFTESGAAHFNHYSRFSMGNDAADYNNDGQVDVVTVDMLPPDEKTLKTYGGDENPDIYKVKLELPGYQAQYSKNCLQRNNGNGVSFSDVSLMKGVSATDWSWSPLLADFDNDGLKDLFISSGIVKRPVDLDYIRFVSDKQISKGLNNTAVYDDETIEAMPDGSSHPFIFQGHGDSAFTDVSKEWGLAGLKGYFNGASYADLDNDGDLDMVINCIDADAVVLKNNNTNRNAISIQFKGNAPNSFGIGAKCWVFSNGKMQYEELMCTRGFESSVEPRLHFGLGSANKIDSILVVWPDNKFQALANIHTGQSITINYSDAGGSFSYDQHFRQPAPSFNPVELKGVDFVHKENEFWDNNVQYLIPHKESTRGPKVAVGDVNNDGLEDFYVCGARGQPGALYVQQKDGSFQSTNKKLFEDNKDAEDVDAIFFDANNDKAQDLLVVSGGNEVLEKAVEGLDRLYLNDGKGNFKLAVEPFSNQYESKSCVAVADVNKDGFNDFFIGNLVAQTAYGEAVSSFLYLSDGGNGHFTLADRKTIYLQKTGMVTSAFFADLNNDTWPDLVITGEWMPVKIFMNNKGHFTETALPNSTGLWQCLYPTDLNGDGKIDFLAGNWGHNSKLWAGKNGPLKLYLKDFDNNNSLEQVMCYTIDGVQYTFLGKDELERALPVLKKAYLTYKEVAGKSVQYMFYDLFKDYTELTAETLSSSAFINDGQGGFTRVDLPDEVQMAPVFAFADKDPGHPGAGWVAVGNFYGVIPYEGRYDALYPTLFGFDKKQNRFVYNGILPAVNGEFRDAKWIRLADGKETLIMARNDKSLLFFQPVK